MSAGYAHDVDDVVERAPARTAYPADFPFASSVTPTEDVAHLSADGHQAICGAKGGNHLGHDRQAEDRCECGAPICKACRAIRRTYDLTGEWEGA